MSSLYSVAFRGEIWVVRHQNRDINISVSVYNKEIGHFAKQKENHLNLDIDGRDVKVLTFSCIVEESTGLKRPCLLIEQNHSEQESSLHFYFFANERTLNKVVLFYHSYRISTGTAFVLSDGPNLSWLSKDKIHFLRFDLQSRNLVHTSHLYPNTTESLTLLWTGTSNGQLLTIACSKENIISADAKNGYLSSDEIIPSIYSSIVVCLCVYDVINTDILLTNNGESCYKQEVYIGTTKGQLIKFTAGKLVSYWQLPFDDPSSIRIAETRNGAICAVVQSKQKIVCLVNLSMNKLVKKWSNQEIILIDDFLENGTNQLCLIQNSASLDNLITSFILTSLDGKTVASDQECFVDKSSISASQSSTECILSTIQALRTRLQASKSHLSELRMEYNDKAQMIGNTCKILHRIADNILHNKDSNINEQTKMSNLVCLIGGETSPEKLKVKTQVNQYECKDEVSHKRTQTWQRVIGNNWIIGADLKRSDISDISLSLVSCSNENLSSSCHSIFDTSNSRLLTVNQDDEISAPSLKRKKIEQSTECHVALVTTLPTFSQATYFTGLVTLSWTCHHGNPLRQIASCGYVHLDINRLTRGDLSISQATDTGQTQRDLTAVKAISYQTTMLLGQVPSPFNMIAALRKEFGMVPVGDVTASESGEILLPALNINGVQEGVGVLVESRTQQCEIQLFTRNPKQVYINIHKIRDALPDDIVINISESVKTNTEFQALHGIQNQLVCIKNDAMKALSNKQCMPTVDLTSASDCSDTKVRNIRKEFEERRKRVSAKQSLP